MSIKVVITSSYPEFTEMAHQVCAQLQVHGIVIEAVLEEAVEQVKTLLDTEQIEVVISRGGTAAALKNSLQVPVVTAEATDFDLLQAFWQAKKLGRRIGFIGYAYDQLEYDFDGLVEILGTQVKQFLYRTTEELRSQVLIAREMGIDVLVGGGSIGVDLAKEHGMQGVLVRSSRRAVVQAIQRARDIVEFRRKDLEQAEKLKTIIDNSYEGIVAIDQQTQVNLISPPAEKILGIRHGEIVGKELSQLPPNHCLKQVFRGGLAKRGDLVSLGDSLLVVNRVPISVKGNHVGMVITFQELSQLQQLEQRIRRELHQKGLVAKFDFSSIIHASAVMAEVVDRAKRFGATDSTVLITGESGTGKELFAQSMHRISKQREGPFVAINCTALPDNLLESELFGYEEGAFTGAKKGGKPGLFELAHGGTIFLDEIGHISKELQARLLRVLQEREVMRLGGDRVIPINVRIIAATNQNLHHMVQQGSFRHDLYYRLNILNLTIPPLRERTDDIPLLVNHFLHYYNNKLNKQYFQLPERIRQWFERYTWPGNVRELENYVQRMVILSDNGSLNPIYWDHLFDDTGAPTILGHHQCYRQNNGLPLDANTLRKTLADCGHNRSEAARRLGISRTTLWKRLKEIGKD